MALQVALIGVGVFLGLAGEEWRQDREDHRLATELLRRFRTEVSANRDGVMRVRSYHDERLGELKAFFAADEDKRATLPVKLGGVRPPTFEHAAWDLALTTQSLAHIDADLGVALSRVYGLQEMTTDLGRAVLQTMYMNPPNATDLNFLAAVQMYFSDLSSLEPRLIAAYDELLPAIDRELAE